VGLVEETKERGKKGEKAPLEGGGHKDRVQEGEYSGNVMYSCMTMER
jgi:hypothetical protein